MLARLVMALARLVMTLTRLSRYWQFFFLYIEYSLPNLIIAMLDAFFYLSFYSDL
jgi:hypothetical protein